jgi:acetyltransferase-like isoleucine patch superfamily enzyme
VIIYADNVFGEGLHIGHRATIRENSRFGSHCSIGTLCDIQGHSEFGDYVRMHSNVHIGHFSKIGNYCWIYPYTVFTNDPTPPSEICVGPTVGDYSIVATHCLLLPGVKIGTHCLIGACTMVSKDVADYQVVVGSPGKPVKDIRDVKDRETGEAHYPWPYRFDRGMPWAGKGYENWLKETDE